MSWSGLRVLALLCLGLWAVEHAEGIRSAPSTDLDLMVEKGQAQIDDSSALVDESDAEGGNKANFWPFTGKKEKKEEHPFNVPIVNKIFANLGEDAEPQDCAQPLLASAKVNRSQWNYIKDSMFKYFLLRQVGDASLLYSTGELWDLLERTPGTMSIVSGMRLIMVNGAYMEEWTWSQFSDAVPFETSEPAETFQVSFQAGYDFRACWGATMTYDHPPQHVCGSEVFATLSKELASAMEDLDKEAQQQLSFDWIESGFKVWAMPRSKLDLLRQVAPGLKEEGDRRQQEQQDLCYRNVVSPICVAVQLPGICRGSGPCLDEEGSDIPEDVFWVAERLIQLPNASSYEERPVPFLEDAIDILNLNGPQVNRHAYWTKTIFQPGQFWRRHDMGFQKMFPEGLSMDSCGSREAALATQLDAITLASLKMTNYSLSGRFYKRDAGHGCECEGREGNQTFFPMILGGVRHRTNLRYRMAAGITNWLDQEVRTLLAITGRNRKPSTYKDNFMRMWPHYFQLEPRFIDDEEDIILKGEHEPAENMSIGTRVRVLSKIKFAGGLFCKDCSGDLDVQGANKSIFVKQMAQEFSESSPRGSSYKFIAGDLGVVVDVLRPGGSHSPMLVVAFDKYKEQDSPVFKVFANQVMAEKRVIIPEVVPTPAPTPESETGTTTNPPEEKEPQEGGFAAAGGGFALLIAALSAALAAESSPE